MDRDAIEQRIIDLYRRVAVAVDSGEVQQEVRALAVSEMRAIDSPLATAMALGMEATGVRMSGNLELAKTLFDKAFEEIESLNEPLWRARLTTGLCHWYAAAEQWSQILPIVEEALQVFGDRPADVWVLSAMSALRDAQATSGNTDAAIDVSRRMIRLALKSGMRNEEGWARTQLGHLLTWVGKPEEALVQLMRAYELAELDSNTLLLERVCQYLANVYSQCGELTRALEYAYKGLHLCPDHDGRSRTTHLISTAIVYHQLGDIDRSIELNSQARDLAHAKGPKHHEAAAIGNLAEAYMNRGEYASALEAVDQAIALHTQVRSGAGLEFSEVLKITILVRAGRFEEAEESLSHFDVRSIKNARIRLNALESTADLAIKRDDRHRAREILMEGLQLAEESSVRSYEADFHKRLRDLALLNSDLASYVEHNDAYTRIMEEVRGTEVMRKATLHEKELEIEKERLERDKERAILHSTLPAHIADRIIRGEDVSGDKHDQASVLFLDIAGFTTHASDLDPQVTTELLDTIFEAFDEICERHDVTKIKTIGDSYLAVAFGSGEGLNAKGLEEAESPEQRSASVALEMMASEFFWPSTATATADSNSNRVEFRIGLHSGPVVAGVIGKQRLQYDVWGDTVNVASRMESTGEPGRIQVSSEFHEQLNNRAAPSHSLERGASEGGGVRFWMTERGLIEIKGKGTMTTYWLEGPTS